MKIAFIGQKGIPSKYGGVEKHVEELVSRLVDEGVDAHVYVRSWYTPKIIVSYKGARLIHLPSIKTKHLDAITHTFFSTLHAIFQKYDVIHYHGVGPALLSWMPRVFSKSKVVVTFHCIDRFHKKWGFFPRLILRLGEWMANRFAHETIAVSRSIAQYCALEYDTKVSYIPNGVHVEKSVDPSKILSEKFGLEIGSYFVMVSRLVEHKGAHYLIEAFQGLDTDRKLIIVGDSVFTDDYVSRLRVMALNDPRIIFVGFQTGEALASLFAGAYLCVHPSDSEGLPISVLEAQGYGTAILVSDIPENIEAVGAGGFLFLAGDVVSLKNQMRFALDNQSFVSQLGCRGREFVSLNYNWDDIALKTLNVYRRNIANGILSSAMDSHVTQS